MQIRPFRGWRYAAPNGEIGPKIAPPYDVLNQADKDRLLAASDENIVAVDLPHMPPKQLGPREEYDRAASLLASWQQSGVLAQDARPCVYVYEQAYEWAGRSYVRRAMIAGVRGTEFGEDVIPHEHTFAGPIADRLMLTELTQTQLSPIFGFYEDAGGKVAGILEAAAARQPDARGTLNGVTERIWAVDDEAAIAGITEALADVPVFIADGHHRYTTALGYRKELAAAEEIPADHEANFVMFALVAKDDPGLVILPTHRLFTGLGQVDLMEKLIPSLPEFSWKAMGPAEAGAAGAEQVHNLLEGASPTAMALVTGTDAKLWLAELADPEAMVAAAPDETDVWRGLPSAIISKLIVEKGLSSLCGGGSPAAEYTAYIDEALDACRTGRCELAVCLKGIGIESIEAIALAGASMPHKSTYFYPKIATGMVLKPLK